MILRKQLPLYLILALISSQAGAQEKWTLPKCVEYAKTNNISVKQADVQARLATLQYEQNRMSLYPTASLGGDLGYSSGRNQNPVSFDLITQGYLSSGFSLQAAVDVFNWSSKRNSIAASNLEAKAAYTNVEKIRNDISLNVAGAYLQALLAREQAKVSEVQVQQSRAQLENTRKLVEAGNLPELNAIQIEAQLANDSSNLITAQGNFRQAILLIKSYLNIDAGASFEIEEPAVGAIPLDDFASLQPETVYSLALQNLPLQRANSLRIDAGKKNIEAARGAMYPSFSLFGSLGSSYNNQATEITGSSSVLFPLGTVNVGGADYDVFPKSPQNIYTSRKMPYLAQLDQNFRQSVGLSMRVPIANGGSLKSAYRRSKLNLSVLELQQDADNQTLKQDIYKAYNDVITSMEKFRAASKTVAVNQKAADFADKRYNIGLLNTIDLITTQNNLFSAKIQALLAQYDYVFKMKVLEFYKGQGLKL